jgi:hypothetical protein
MFLYVLEYILAGLAKSTEDAKNNWKLFKNAAVLLKINAYSRANLRKIFC